MKQYYKSKQCQFCKNFFNPHSPNHKYCSAYCTFWDYVKLGDASECWPWIRGKNSDGYGIFKHHGKTFSAHRFMWTEMFGKIPDGMHVLHKCDNPLCVNPNHFFLGTQVDNIKDMMLKGRSRNSKGEYNNKAKLTTDNVINIRQLLSKGIFQKHIANLYNISRCTISHIESGYTWSHI